MTGWRHEPFDNVIADESGGNLKTPQSEFLSSGRYAIVDQGKELVAGYTDDESRLCRAELPVIVFGDHTRCFKYVDFPFCMGADGVKVLRPKVEADVKYLYHYLRQLRLTEGGYDRHFKYLKRSSVALPPLPEQRRIAEILDKADALRAKRRAALAQLDTLTQSIFFDMFGDPATNPKGWPRASLIEHATITYGFPFDSQYFGQEGRRKVVRIRDVVRGDSDTFYSGNESFEAKHVVQDGDILVGMDGEFNCARWTGGEALLNQRVCRFTASSDDLHDAFLFTVLPSFLKRIEAETPFVTVKHLSAKQINQIRIPLPPQELQGNFAQRAAMVARQDKALSASLAEMNALFASLQHRAFRGEL